MSEVAAAGTAAPPRRPSAAARVWFAGMVASWMTLAVLVLASPATLTDVWAWIRDLPLGAEVVLWVLTLPWMLALAVRESSWDEWLRILLLVAIAGGWSIASIPRRGRADPAGHIH